MTPETTLADTRSGLKRLALLLEEAAGHIDDKSTTVASSLVGAARDEVAHLRRESEAAKRGTRAS